MTFRPFGPRVTLTARASLEMPRFMASRASWSNAICLAAIVPPGSMQGNVFVRFTSQAPGLQAGGFEISVFHHGEHILLPHQEDVGTGPLFAEFVAGPGREQDGVALLDLQRAAG